MGNFYTLAHGDTFPDCWEFTNGMLLRGRCQNWSIIKIQNGTTGDNTMHASTGDLVELSNGDVGIVYVTQDGRTKRDLRLTLISGRATSTKDIHPSKTKEVWLTSNTVNYVG